MHGSPLLILRSSLITNSSASQAENSSITQMRKILKVLYMEEQGHSRRGSGESGRRAPLIRNHLITLAEERATESHSVHLKISYLA